MTHAAATNDTATAYHEAAHAVIDVLCRITIVYATIIPELREMGVVKSPSLSAGLTPEDAHGSLAAATANLLPKRQQTAAKLVEQVLGHVRIKTRGLAALERLTPRQEAFVRREICALFAGRIAERRKTSVDNATGARSDEQRASELVCQLSNEPAVQNAILAAVRASSEACARNAGP